MSIELEDKMQIAFEAFLEIERAKSEEEACIQAILSLERLHYKQVMLSFLQTIGSERFVVASPALTTGNKWKSIVDITVRSFDSPTDLLPLVLKRRKARFILDSREDPEKENDCETCRRLNVVTQYVMPLATESMLIGTLQVDMGELPCKPAIECAMLDALAAHLSIAIERYRALIQLHAAHNELMGKTKLIAYEAAAANILHALSHSVGDYARRLNGILGMQNIRTNKEAYRFLEFTKARVSSWIDDLEANTMSFRRNEQTGRYSVDEVIQQVVESWYRKAKIWHCSLSHHFIVMGIKVEVRLGALKELLSCLIVNAIEANARQISVFVNKTRRDSSGMEKPFAEISVQDDGDGIPSELKSQLFQLGWTTKTRGHGIGLTMVLLLTREMGGFLEIRSHGRAAGEKYTDFVICLPSVS